LKKMGLYGSRASALCRLQESFMIQLGGRSYIPTEFGIHMKLVRLIKMCLTETCS
jgi:hypothetical protein